MKLAFVIPFRSTFIHTDERILGSQYELRTLCLNQNQGRLPYLWGMIKMMFLLMWHRDWNAVLIWFADYHACPAVAIARLLKRRSLVLIGGYDAVHYPEFGYGVFANPLRGLCARYALRYSDLIIANHEALLKSSNTYYKPSGHLEGVFHLVPGLKTRAIVIHNALSVSCDAPSERKRMILSIGGTPRFQDIVNKGFDLLFGVAPEFPDWTFVCVGINSEWMSELDSQFQVSGIKNLVILPQIPHEEIIALMQEASIYVQASISEGMPNALMEAMACGCIPIGSNVAGIPTVIGEHGYIIKNRSPKELAEALQKATSDTTNRQSVAESTHTRFAFELRQERILQAVNELFQS
jgi:glycosyltransferase involved in cell wall biosynthesis